MHWSALVEACCKQEVYLRGGLPLCVKIRNLLSCVLPTFLPSCVQRKEKGATDRVALQRVPSNKNDTSMIKPDLRGMYPSNESIDDEMCDRYLSKDYELECKEAWNNPEEYWGRAGSKYVTWFKPWDKVLDNSKEPFTKWFPGGQLNVCYNCVDKHVEEGHGEQIALIHDSPITKAPTRFLTYKQLLDEVSRLAGVFSTLGVKTGDRVLIYMPMMSEAVAAMLATARLGAIHSLVFGGFAASELAVRINHALPTLLVTTNAGFEPGKSVPFKKLVDIGIRKSGDEGKAKLKHVLVLERPEAEPAPMQDGRDVYWLEAMDKAKPHDCVPVESNSPLYILYTSGTTGDPKGILRPSGPHAVALPWSMDKIFDAKPGERWWAASDLGWVVGHSYICYAPLLRRLTSVVYEGKPVGTPDAGQFFRVIRDHGVETFFTAPTALRVIRRTDKKAVEAKKYKIPSLKRIFVAGEHCDQKTRRWSEEVFGVSVLDHWWQTETGHPITSPCVGLGHSFYPPEDVSGMPVPGYNVQVLKKDGSAAAPGDLGRIVIKCPLPPGCMSTLYRADDRFQSNYFTQYPGYYDTMDAGFIDPDGFVCVMARDDDVINVAGHRLSTSAIEEAILGHTDVVDCAVISVPDKLKGEIPVGCQRPEEAVEADLVKLVRKLVGPVAAYRISIRVRALPRTRSGKTARKSIADIARNRQIK
ncbi:unnamed protein product, partial [Notodromas monacha]